MNVKRQSIYVIKTCRYISISLEIFFCSDDTEDVDEDESDDDDDEIEKEDVEDEEEDSDDEAEDDFMVNREKVQFIDPLLCKTCLETCFLLFRTYQI